ncbi:MAG TPA: hypothetical protein VFE58_11415 [Tepidisphaeraceae bacterium]|jgi:hypothetical protein|nr:hypothetical protein [Tepidisphaeraceae bacterium]
MNSVDSAYIRIDRAGRTALLIGVAGLLFSAVGYFTNPDAFFRAYLWSWLLCLAAALGAMSVVMLHHLTGGAWGWLVRRPAEAAAMTLPLLTLLFIPIALGARHIFPWAVPDLMAHNALLQHRRPLFTTGFTILRSFIYLLIWIFMAWRLHKLSLEHDLTGSASSAIRMRRLSAVGFVVYFATMSLASMDWIASREVNWYSSTFGLAVLVGQSVTGIAVLIVVLAMLSKDAPLSGIIESGRLRDVGNLLLTAVILWAYISFAQLLVIWMGNTQEDIIWYIHRTHHGWWWVSLALILFHFAVPFVLMLFQQSKRHIRSLAMIAGGLLVMRAVNLLWMIEPSTLSQEPLGISWLDFIAPIGVGGVWFSCFMWLLKHHPLMPLGHRVSMEPLSYVQPQSIS